MRYWRVILLVILLLLLGGAALAYLSLQPRVVSVFPADGSVDLHGTTTVQVTFSTSIRSENIEKYLTLEPNTTGVYQMIGNTLIFSPSIPWKQDVTVKVSLQPGLRSSLGIPLAKGMEWQFATRHPWLLFLLDESDGTHLYAVDPQGLDVNRLLQNNDSVMDYTAASGSVIYYSARTTLGSVIRRYDLASNQTTDILDCGSLQCAQPRLSPDGQLLVYSRTGIGETSALWQVSLAEGQRVGPPALLGSPGHLTRDPSWSSGGWLAYYDQTAAAFQFVDPSTGAQTAFENTTGEPGTWSADGSYYTVPDLSYTQGGAVNPEYFSQLISYDPVTGQRSELTRDNRMEDLQPAYSPDGRQLVFARRFLNPQNWTPGRQIWAMNVDGTNVRPLTNTGVIHHLGFAWSPDGSMLAYLQLNTASFSGQRQLLLMDMASGMTQQVIMNAYNLQWLP